MKISVNLQGIVDTHNHTNFEHYKCHSFETMWHKISKIPES